MCHVLKVFFAFASAAIRIQTSGFKKFYMSSMDKSIDGDVAQYGFGLVLKETMLNLGPTFIKGKKQIHLKKCGCGHHFFVLFWYFGLFIWAFSLSPALRRL